ncbi:MAG: helix-turn-helix transcriptional regulator [Nitrospirota bacterium]|nr:helix-turn-helix transcriptional regulator [Nitrospirota bacterium]MDH5699433.1 helix-turn-helix transcriptional regulator [Nitrospirota bacterium]
MTLRQYHIAQEVRAGLTNVEIAGHLDITERTVKSHLQKIYRKLKVSNRYGLLTRLVEDGMEVPGRSLQQIRISPHQ